MSTATGPLSCWCAGRRRTGNGRKIIQYVWNRSRFGPPRRLFLVGYGASPGGQRRPLLRKRYKKCGWRAVEDAGPYGGYKSCGTAGRCGERTERCQWQRKRSERVAAVKISSVRRKAAQKFWAPQQGHRPLRNRIMGCVGEGLCPSHGRGRTPPLRRGYKKCGGAGRPGGRPLRYYPRLFAASFPIFPLTTVKKSV